MSNEVMLFKNKELKIELKGYISNDNQVMVNVEAIARGVKGKYIQVKNNKEYLRLTNIKADLDKFGFPIQSGKDFIPESAMYLLIMNGDGDFSRKFQMWIATEVLPSIRKHGAYIGNGEIDEEYIDNKIRFSEKRTINTFGDSNVDDVKQLVKDFKDYVVDLDTKTRVVRCKSSIKGLQRLHDKVAKESTLNIAECYKILQYKDEIKSILHEAENRNKGQKIGHRNRKINKLSNELEKVCPTRS